MTKAFEDEDAVLEIEGKAGLRNGSDKVGRRVGLAQEF